MDEFGIDFQILQSHLDDYKKKKNALLAKMLFFRIEDKLHLLYGRIRPIFEDEDFVNEELDYTNVVFSQKVIPSEELDALIDNLRKPQEPRESHEIGDYFAFNNILFISAPEPSFSKVSYDPRWLKHMNFHPLCRTIFTVHYSNPSFDKSSTLFTTDANLPYYPKTRELILDKFKFDIDSYFPVNSLHIALIPLSGHISAIQIRENALAIQVENNDNLALTLKVYGEKRRRHCETFNFTANKSETVTLPADYSVIKAILVDQDGIILDTREFFKQEKSRIGKIEELIYQGEGEEIEFKLWNPNVKGEGKENRKKKYAKLMTAFANTKGGAILFGVSDEAEIVGIEKKQLDEIDKFLTDICEEKTIPRVQVRKDFVNIDNEIIGVLLIAKSEKITQNGYDKHYYIRRGSTNRVMRPEEIETSFKKAGW